MNIPSSGIRIGSRGQQVADIQRELKEAGFDPQGIDGDFGPKTQEAVLAFQRARKLTVDGVVDRQTWTALEGDHFESSPGGPAQAPPTPGSPNLNIPSASIRLGSRGKQVADLQRELKEAGFDPQGLDGVFGPMTQEAVLAFQRARKLTVDGVVGRQTWTALGGDQFESATSGPPQAPPSPGSTGARLFGADTSHWQSDATFERSIKGAKFAAIGVTDGHTYVDPTMRVRWNELGQRVADGKMKLRIAYHFLEPGDGVGQAQHFLATLGVQGKLPPGTRLALDWEAKALADPRALGDAARYIHGVTGIWPLVYASQSRLGQVRQVVPQAPVWDAKWTNGLDDQSSTFVQYAKGPDYDRDVFNGDLKQLEKFAGY